MPLLLSGKELEAETKRAKTLKHITVTTRESSDAIMMGIGAFTPLTGFMTKADWKGVCDNYTMADGTFWPIPITVSTNDEAVKVGDDIALDDEETGTTVATMNVTEKYTIDKEYECKAVFKTVDKEHPGVEKVMAQAKYNLAGPIKVLSEIYYPEQFKGLYQRPAESRKIFSDLGWKRIAALQLRNPKITWGEMVSVLPFGNRTVILTLTGAQLGEAFLYGFSPFCNSAIATGRFPQVSGLRVTFACNGTTPVVTGMWKTATGTEVPIGPRDTVRFVTNDFMYTGGDGYTVFTQGTNVLQPGYDLLQVAIDYVAANSPVAPVVEGRIVGP